MPLPLRDRKIGAIEYVIKRIKGSDSYDRMKEDNENGYGREKLMMRDEPECDYKVGMKQSVDEMMNAVESRDRESFERGLRAFVSMMIDAQEADEKMEEKNEM